MVRRSANTTIIYYYNYGGGVFECVIDGCDNMKKTIYPILMDD